MKNLVLLFLAAAACLVTSAAASPDARAIQGLWKPVTAVLAGAPMPDAVIKIISLRMDQGKYEVFVGDEPDRGTYTLDAGTTPRQITVVGTEGPNKGKTFPAIYELDGDSLRICYDLSGAKFPAKFESTTGTLLYLVTYQRAKQ